MQINLEVDDVEFLRTSVLLVAKGDLNLSNEAENDRTSLELEDEYNPTTPLILDEDELLNMSIEVEQNDGSIELEDIEGEESPRIPLINGNKNITYFKFPTSPRSILTLTNHHTPRPAVFLTVPGQTSPLPSPIYPTSTS